jgi:hypothetical protein
MINALAVVEEIMALTKRSCGKTWSESNIVFHVAVGSSGDSAP